MKWFCQIFTGKFGGFVARNRSEMSEIGLVANERNDDVAVDMLTQLGEPFAHILERAHVGYVVDDEGAERAPVVAGREDARSARVLKHKSDI